MNETNNSKKYRGESRTMLVLPLAVRVAGAAVLVIAAAAYFYFNRSPNDARDYFNKYFEPYPVHDTLLYKGAYSAAIRAYQDENYVEAVIQWDSLVSRNPENHVLVLYRGISHLGRGDGRRAIADFESIYFKQKPLNPIIGWYLGLAWLQTGDEKTACEMFNNIKAQQFKRKEIGEIIEGLCE